MCPTHSSRPFSSFGFMLYLALSSIYFTVDGNREPSVKTLRPFNHLIKDTRKTQYTIKQ